MHLNRSEPMPISNNQQYLAIVAPQQESPLRLQRILSDPDDGIALDTDRSKLSGS
ncbi:hypothetical protein V1517DRAFT_334359 [Lipomyces orientalis]|uniref:Uncharacterized protein n=1 Tax=Lipomyces orientalis TaxID=1233043 RepID=A0ACC3TCZ6_9ASCO